MKKILIVDDSAFMRTILKDILLDKDTGLNSNEIEIYDADSKESALKLFKEIKPDVILLDIVMKNSETDGIDFIKEIKDSFHTKNIIMITSIGLNSIIKQCQEYGVKHYLQKPFERETVLETVYKTLSQHETFKS